MEIRFGFTLDDLHRVAAAAARSSRSMFGDFSRRYAEAYSTLAEHLFAATEAVTERDLYWAAVNGLRNQADKDRSTHGIVRYEGGGSSDPGEAPNFVIFWDARRVEPSHEDRVVDRLALHQILPTLTAQQRQVIGALAAFDDHEPARHALGDMPRASYAQALSKGRRRFFAYWHEGETPRGAWAPDRRGTDLRRALRDRRAKANRTTTPA